MNLMLESSDSEEDDEDNPKQEWIGNFVKTNGQKHYRGLKMGDEEFYINDCALFYAENREPYIGRIMDFWEKANGKKMVLAKW
jgi:hypothetical protein